MDESVRKMNQYQGFRSSILRLSKDHGGPSSLKLSKNRIVSEAGIALEKRINSWERLIAGDSRKSVNLVIKAVGDACDMACHYCPTVRLDKSGKMPIELLDEIFTDGLLKEFTDVNVTWHGGEPLLAGLAFYRNAHSRIRSLAKDREVTFSMQSNGLSINDEWIEFLLAERVSLGISLDGPREVHDAHRVSKRGDPTFDVILRNIETAKRYGLDLGINFVLPDDPDLFLTSEEFIKNWTLTPIQLEIKFDLDGSRFAHEYGQWLGHLFCEWAEGNMPKSFSPILFQSILHQAIVGAGDLCWIGGTCAKHIGVNPRGKVSPCCDRLVGSKRWVLADVKDTELASILNGSPMAEFFEITTALHQDCRTCEFKNVCNGGCTFYRIGRDGSIGKDPMCSSYKPFFGICLQYIENTLSEIEHI